MAILSNFQANGQEAIKLAPPAQSVSLTYTGNAQSPTWTEYPTSVITVTSTPQTNAGTYNATAAIPAGYVWADTLKGGQRNIPWTIGKASGGTIVLSKNAVEIGEGESDTITATLTGAGDTLSAVSSDNDVATASVSGNTITITDGGTEGTATITVSADGNYAYTDVVIGVTTQYVTIVTWASGTDAEIVAMCEASDAGTLNLSDYWNVGDKRTVSLSGMPATGVGESHGAQDVVLVLVDANNPNYQYVTATSGRTYCNFVVQQESCLSSSVYGTNSDPEMGYMSSYSANSWESSNRRVWCNNIYVDAIPNTLRSIFKQVVVKQSDSISTNDYFFLPTEKEVIGKRKYSSSYEADVLSPWYYYDANSSNRIKKIGLNGVEWLWWTRSTYYNTSTSFVRINSDGTSGYAGGSASYGIAPCGCI